MNKNQRLKDEIRERCRHHQPGVHYLQDPNMRASDIHRMNRARTAFFAPLASELIFIDRNDRESFEAASSKKVLIISNGAINWKSFKFHTSI